MNTHNPFETQRLVIYALCTLHNYIQRDSMEIEEEDQFDENAIEEPDNEAFDEDAGQVNAIANELREKIANDMWADYLKYNDANDTRRVNNYLYRIE